MKNTNDGASSIRVLLVKNTNDGAKTWEFLHIFIPTMSTATPYSNPAINLIYNLLFCDDLNLFKANQTPPFAYPFDVLFSDASTVADLQKLIDAPNSEPRLKILSYNKQASLGYKVDKKDLLAVIVEVGLEDGLDVLASFKDGTARYINQTGKLIVWEMTGDEEANRITKDLFAKSEDIVKKIGPWDQPRRSHPAEGTVRITFLVSDGLYFGEGPIDVLFNDAIAGPSLGAATELLQFLTEKG